MITATKPGDVQSMQNPKFIGARNDELPRLWIDSPIAGTSEQDADLFVPYEDYGKDPITGEKVEPETVKAANGLLLDSWKIRRTGWEKLSTHDACWPYAYQLPPTASSSEKNTPSWDAITNKEFCEERLFHRHPRLVE
jgi:hypothetical protein